MLEDDDAGISKLARSVPVGAVQLAHTLVPSEAAEATVTGWSPGPGGNSEAGENQGEQEAHIEREKGLQWVL